MSVIVSFGGKYRGNCRWRWLLLVNLTARSYVEIGLQEVLIGWMLCEITAICCDIPCVYYNRFTVLCHVCTLQIMYPTVVGMKSDLSGVLTVSILIIIIALLSIIIWPYRCA